jgi:hypothetical protein
VRTQAWRVHRRVGVVDVYDPMSAFAADFLEADDSTLVVEVLAEGLHDGLGVFERPVVDVVEHGVDIGYELVT